MKDTFIPPMPLGGLGPKILLEENKIKNIENRLMGPNNEGKAPSECQPLKESELENIKTKIILNGPLAPKEIKENINTINDTNKIKSINIIKNNTINKSEEKFLNKKRNFDDKALNEDLSPNEKHSSNQSFSEKSSKSDNNNSELSPKNNTTNTNGANASNKYNKSILDYYPTKFISRSYNNSNIIKNNNYSSTHKKNSGEKNNNNNKDNKDISNNELELKEQNINRINNTEYNTIEQLMKKLNEQNLIIESKDKEISSMKLLQKENEEIINNLQEYKKNSDIEIKRCRLDISNMVKEISTLQREKKNKWINEQEYNLGKFGIQRFSHGQILDYWEDGAKIIELKKNLENIKQHKKKKLN